MHMPKEMKQKWMDALRSGEFAQIEGVLHREEEADVDPLGGCPEGYCCLGVLGTICGFDKSDGYTLRHDELSAKDVDLDQAYFTQMNDVEGKTFSEIADEIDLVVEAV
jgi:hypothetical protein